VGVVTSCAAAFDRVGLPEGRFHLAQATLYLATTDKSNSTLGLFDAIAAVRAVQSDEIPAHLRDANRDGQDLGHGAGYLYPHAYENHWVAQRYLPDELREKVFYQGGSLGWEGKRDALVRERRLLQLSVMTEEEREVWSVPPSSEIDGWIRRTGSANGGAESVRQRLMAGLDLVPTDRVLLHGNAVEGFIGPVMERVSAGLTAVWTDTKSCRTITHTLGGDRGGDGGSVYRPEIHDMDEIPDNAFSGPFEVILHRSIPSEPADAALSTLVPLLDIPGTLRVVVTSPGEGDGPASVLSLPPEIRQSLQALQNRLYPSPREEWSAAVASLPGDWKVMTDTVTTTVNRRLDTATVRSWFHQETPLGEAVTAELGEEQQREIGQAVSAFESGDYPWRRSYLIVTIRRGRP
jgi:putative ATPase